MTDQRIGTDYVTGLPVPDVVNWPIFPFKGELQVRTVRPFAETEYPRSGEPEGPPCHCSGRPEAEQPAASSWESDDWLVRPIRFGDTAAPFPAYMLETVNHIDFEDFDDEMAADFGVISVRLERAIRGLGTVGRVHVNRWGDGGSHGRDYEQWHETGSHGPRPYRLPVDLAGDTLRAPRREARLDS